MRNHPRIGMLAASLGMISGVAPAMSEQGASVITIQDDPKIPRMIERMERAWADEIATRKERRQWNKPAKKPKALRGRP